jgi:hypothetical protein
LISHLLSRGLMSGWRSARAGCSGGRAISCHAHTQLAQLRTRRPAVPAGASFSYFLRRGASSLFAGRHGPRRHGRIYTDTHDTIRALGRPWGVPYRRRRHRRLAGALAAEEDPCLRSCFRWLLGAVREDGAAGTVAIGPCSSAPTPSSTRHVCVGRGGV